ncbi:MAG: DUF5916 domain-containing protein [candidate division WOR-3 bacterium]
MISFFVIVSLETISLSKFKEGEIIIDGVISEEAWNKVSPITEFFEFRPVEGGKPSFKTELFLGYDNNNLYVAFKCYDDMKTVRKTLTKRDELSTDDMVWFELDIYGKGESYIFGTNPLGVQFDGKRVPPNFSEDYSFDTYFEVKSFISDSFWSAEFKIPFSSLRFQSKEKQEWILVAFRLRPRETFIIYTFPLISRNNPLLSAQGARIIIPERIYSREKRYDIIPYLISSQSGIKEIEYQNDKVKFNAGLSGKIGLKENLILDYALNPDFSQIETDIPQIDVNTTYALYYPEKRPLFMEGSEFATTSLNLFYTRMVNNPLYALKLTGKISLFDLYFLSSYDENTIYILPFEDASFSFSSNKKSFINFLRMRSTFLNNQSYIGFLIGDREVIRDSFDNGFGRIFAFDTRIIFLRNYILEYQGGYSYVKEPDDTALFPGIGINFKEYTDRFDGEKFSGYANYLSFSSIFRNLVLSLFYKENSEGFRSDIGFIERNNFKIKGVLINPRFYPNKFGFTEINFWTNYTNEENFEGVLKQEKITFGFSSNFSFSQLTFGSQYSIEDKNTFNIYFLDYSKFNDIYTYSFWLNGTPFKFLDFQLRYKEGKAIFYQMDTLLYNATLSGYFNFKFTRFVFYVGFDNQVFYLERYKDKITEALVFYSGLNYSFTDKVFTRINITYYKDLFGIYPLFTYQLNPFTVFYLGANINAMKYGNKLEGENHQIFLKFQYMFKI